MIDRNLEWLQSNGERPGQVAKGLLATSPPINYNDIMTQSNDEAIASV